MYFKPAHSRSLQTSAAFWPKVAEHDVTKTPFSLKKKNLNRFSRHSDGRRQIDVGEGTESFVSISAAVFELSRKSGRGGGQNVSPQRDAGLWSNYSLHLPSQRKYTFSALQYDHRGYRAQDLQEYFDLSPVTIAHPSHPVNLRWPLTIRVVPSFLIVFGLSLVILNGVCIRTRLYQ